MDGLVPVESFPQLMVQPYALGTKTGGTYSILLVPLIWCAWWCKTGEHPGSVSEADMRAAHAWWSKRFSGWGSWCHRIGETMSAPPASVSKTAALYPGSRTAVPYIGAATQEKIVKPVDGEIAASVAASQPATHSKRSRGGEKKTSPKKIKQSSNQFMF